MCIHHFKDEREKTNKFSHFALCVIHSFADVKDFGGKSPKTSLTYFYDSMNSEKQQINFFLLYCFSSTVVVAQKRMTLIYDAEKVSLEILLIF